MNLLERVKEWQTNRQAEQGLEAIEKQYTHDYAKVAINLYRSLIYRQIADLLRLAPRNIHVDFGCGLAFLLEEIRKLHPQAALIGTDRNVEILRRSHKSLFPPVVIESSLHVERRVSVENETLKLDYEPDKTLQETDDSLPIPGGPVLLIADDMRNMKVLKHLLGKRKIQSATLTFPGVGFSELGEEAPRESDLNLNIHQLSERTKQETLRQVWRCLAEVMEPGGQLIFCDMAKILIPIPELVLAEIKTVIREAMGDTAKYWHAEYCVFSNISGRETFSGSKFALTTEGQKMNSGDPVPFMFSIRRNETP
jgi:hypothetical protein